MNNNIIQVKLSEIKIGDRRRNDMGDLKALAQSIEETGLLQPIGITPEKELVFGERRLRTYRDLLRRETIPARIIEVESVLHGQLAENLIRKDFTVSERVAIVDALRIFQHGGDRRSDQVRNSDDETLTVDELSKRVGLGGKDRYFDAQKVIAKGVPEGIEAMDSGDLAVSGAAELAQAPEDEQAECMKRKFDGDKLTARAIKKHLRRITNRKDREETLDRAVKEVDRDDAIQIHHCPFQHLEEVAEIEPESVQLVCTDIPYDQSFLPQVAELGEFARRILLDGGLFVTYCGQYWLHKVIDSLGKHLTYRWVNASVWKGDATPIHIGGWKEPHGRVLSNWKPIVVFSKGGIPHKGQWNDVSYVKTKEKDWHPWQQPLAEVEKLVRDLCKPGNIVVDPCGGGFTTAIACLRNHRRFIGCDVGKAAVIKGQERLAEERSRAAVLPVDFEPDLPEAG